mmetsp:Transcript_6714/g.12190  ORF Transcript_6714/g.12190 Transcript_6714/m.12190 type:complete len:271 (-) Transcript_6714:145-957(-)
MPYHFELVVPHLRKNRVEQAEKKRCGGQLTQPGQRVVHDVIDMVMHLHLGGWHRDDNLQEIPKLRKLLHLSNGIFRRLRYDRGVIEEESVRERCASATAKRVGILLQRWRCLYDRCAVARQVWQPRLDHVLLPHGYRMRRVLRKGGPHEQAADVAIVLALQLSRETTLQSNHPPMIREDGRLGDQLDGVHSKTAERVVEVHVRDVTQSGMFRPEHLGAIHKRELYLSIHDQVLQHGVVQLPDERIEFADVKNHCRRLDSFIVDTLTVRLL